MSIELALLHWHAEKLINAGLARVYIHGDRSFDPRKLTRTRVGDKLLQLIGEPAFRDAELI